MDTQEKNKLLDVREGKPSASGLGRLMACPGSWKAESACPSTTSEAAEMGTRLHKHMEDGTMPSDPEEAEAVQWCREMEERLVEQYIRAFAAGEAVANVREERMWDAARRFSGQGDSVWTNGPDALVIDYKFGRVQVEDAEENAQLYGLSLLTFDNMPEVRTVYSVILQPYVSRKDPAMMVINAEQVGELRSYIYECLDEAGAADARLVPGESQCRYCRAAASCPAAALAMQKVSALDLKNWEAWTPTQKKQLYDVSRVAKRWADAVEKRVKDDLIAGQQVDGLVLGAGRSQFSVTDATKAFSELHEFLGLSGDEFAACCKVQMTALDALVHAKLMERDRYHGEKKQTTKESREWLRKMLMSKGCGAETVSAGTIKASNK